MLKLNRNRYFNRVGAGLIVLGLFFTALQAPACGRYSYYPHYRYYHPHLWHNGAAVVAGIAVGALIATAVTSQHAFVFQAPVSESPPPGYRTCVTRYDRYGKYYHCTVYR